jgi:hypothetical protein
VLCASLAQYVVRPTVPALFRRTYTDTRASSAVARHSPRHRPEPAHAGTLRADVAARVGAPRYPKLTGGGLGPTTITPYAHMRQM